MIKNYIDIEEFRRQSEKTQKILIDWWQPQKGDLVTFKTNPTVSVNSTNSGVDFCIQNKHKGDLIPLLQLQQLMQFVEDMEGGIHTIDHDVVVWNITLFGGKAFRSVYDNILMVFWEIAVSIAESMEVGNE